MYCSKCGTQIPDNAVYCPVCGNKNENAVSDSGLEQHQTGWQNGTGIIPPVSQSPSQSSGAQMPPVGPQGTQGVNTSAQSPQSGVNNSGGWNLNVQPDTVTNQFNGQQSPMPNYNAVHPHGSNKNKTVLIIIIAVISVLLILAVIFAVLLLKRMKEDEKDSSTNIRRTTTEAVIATDETTITTTQTTSLDPDQGTENTTEPPTETTPEQTETTQLQVDIIPGLVPDHIWEYTDFAAELSNYAGHYQGYITTSVADLESIYIFQEEERQDILNKIIEASKQDYFTDLFVYEDSLEAFSEHPLAYEDGSFMYFDPFELTAGGYFEEYSNPAFDGTDVSQYGYVQTAFYQLPGQPPSFYLLNYEEYEWEGEIAYFEVRIDVQFIE